MLLIAVSPNVQDCSAPKIPKVQTKFFTVMAENVANPWAVEESFVTVTDRYGICALEVYMTLKRKMREGTWRAYPLADFPTLAEDENGKPISVDGVYVVVTRQGHELILFSYFQQSI